MILLSLFAVVTAQQLSNVGVAVASNAISGYPLTSPWAVAISSSNVVYFSNFGGADSLDYIGSVNIDNSNPQKLVALADLNGTIPYFLVKHLATNGATVYAAVYGGPCKLVFAGSRPAVYQERCAAGTSYILKCEDGTACAILVTIKDSMGSTWIPTAVAYSTSLSRLFYAVADGNLQNSTIYSVKDDGSEVESYVTQITSGCEYPVGLAVDDVNALLFWANDVGPNKIVQGALGTTFANVGTILKNPSSFPQSIAVDTAAQYVYFTDQTSSPNAIARVRYGTGQYDADLTTLYSSTASPMTPTGIAISMSQQYVYWADTGSSTIMRGSLSDIGSQAPVMKKSNAVTLTGSVVTLIMCIGGSVMLL